MESKHSDIVVPHLMVPQCMFTHHHLVHEPVVFTMMQVSHVNSSVFFKAKVFVLQVNIYVRWSEESI